MGVPPHSRGTKGAPQELPGRQGSRWLTDRLWPAWLLDGCNDGGLGPLVF